MRVIGRLTTVVGRWRWPRSPRSSGSVGPGRQALPEDAPDVTRLRDAAVAARVLVAGIGNLFLRRRRLRPRGRPPARRAERACRDAASASSTTASAACTWPTTCSTGTTRWSSWTRCPAAEHPGSVTVLEVGQEDLGAAATSTRTAWTRSRCSASLRPRRHAAPRPTWSAASPRDLAEGIGLSPDRRAAVPRGRGRPSTLSAQRLAGASPRRTGGLTCASASPAGWSSSLDGYGGQLALVDVAGAAAADQPRHAGGPRRRRPATGC